MGSTKPTETRVSVAGFVGRTATSDLGSINKGSKYRQELDALFVAPQTAHYRFMVLGDDSALLKLDTGAGLVKVASAPSHSDSYLTYPSQTSEPILLTAGERYPIKGTHKEGDGNDYIQAAVEIIDAGSPDPLGFQYHRVNEIQRVLIEADLARYQLQIRITNVTGGTF